ncbi:Eukaryotic translation initiation factor 4 gamma [Halocaridina rubra]|uniref:Eukaryotic translation initiation factor 4 gamma n=1 Tax=Halocaridina rubra TaxID=373956 RepID=A0AAN8XLC9_HALRR
MYPNGYPNGYPPAGPLPNGGGVPFYGFQHLGPSRQATTHSPGQFHPSQMTQQHPQGHYQTIQYGPPGGKHEAPPITTMQYRQPQPVYFTPSVPQQPMKPIAPTTQQRQRKLLSIVDPNTGKNILDDINNDKAEETPTPSHSSESSASNTPAPSGTPPNKAEPVNTVALQFVTQVAQIAAAKNPIETETTESLGRTNKQSEPSTSNIIISESRESKDKFQNSIVNKVDHVNSDHVDSCVGKSVPESMDGIKPQTKPESNQVPYQQQIPPVSIPVMLPPVAMQQMSQSVPPQQIPQQMPQAPLQVPQPPVQVVSPLPPQPQAPQQAPVVQVPPPQPQQQPIPPQQQQPQPQQQQKSQPPSNQLNQQQQQLPQKQKSPSPIQNVKIQQSTPQVHAQPILQQVVEPTAAVPQPQQPPVTSAQNVAVAEADQKIENLSQMMSSVQIEVPNKPEPSLPVKQPSPKPATVLPTPLPKEKEVTPEPQPIQSKRRGGPREEPTPARENVEENAVQIPQQPQKPATPPAVQQQQQQPPSNKLVSQPIQNAKEKEKTPEPSISSQSSPIPPHKSTSLPASKEATPQPAISPTPSEDPKSERSSKEREVNSGEAEVNNIHDVEEKDDKTQFKYTYKDDQWSPQNPDGKRQYDRNFLLELQNNPLSLKKPESLPNLEVVRGESGRHKNYDARVPMPHIGSGPDFTPDYVKPAMTNKQPRMGVGRNNSQQRRGEPGGGQVSRGDRSRPGQSKVIVIPLSTGREPKLKTTENAWKPCVLENSTTDDEQAATQEVVKRMRGILNKLTPEKFDKLVGTVQQMPINTTEHLSAVIDLIFEKAVDEQGFSSTYASLCQVLSKMSVRGEGDEGKAEVKFRNLIINKCQKEYEKDNLEEIKPIRMREIEQCPDPDKKAELQAKWEYDEAKLRQRSVGNIRFIGELYKLKMLTSHIMMRIIGNLLEKCDEESLECVCKLLTTIGKILEMHCSQLGKPKEEELDKHFHTMLKIVTERLTSSRVRFLMMDVIDLRKNNWVPRREDNKPKTKAQVHEEVKREEYEQQNLLVNNRRDDRDRDRGDRDRKRSRDNRGPTMSDGDNHGGWSVVAPKSRAFDSSRLKITFNRPGGDGGKDVILRGIGFGNWGRGSSGGVKDHVEIKQQENRFTVLSDGMPGNPLSGDARRGGAPSMGRLGPGGGPSRQASFGSKSMPPPSDEKESALFAVKKFVGHDRSKSTSRPESRENSVSRENDILKGSSAHGPQEYQFVVSVMEEYALNGDPEEVKLWLKERYSTANVKDFIDHSLTWVLDRDANKRKRVGELYHDILLSKYLSVDQFIEGTQASLSMIEDYVIDIPQVCDYFGEIFAPCLNDNVISLQQLLDMCSFANSKSATIFACILAKAAKIISPNKVADMWNNSGLSWANIVPVDADVDDFLTKQQVEFTKDRSKSSCSSGWDRKEVEAELLKLFSRPSNDEIFNWIDANIGNDANSSKFIRALVTALVESQAMTSNDGSSIRATGKFEENMKHRLQVVRKYVDGNDRLELQCIYALQAICVTHQHPPGLLEQCFNAFYDSEVVSEEAFDEWLKSQDPEEQEGRGVCVASVQSFMRWLKEADVEEPETH